MFHFLDVSLCDDCDDDDNNEFVHGEGERWWEWLRWMDKGGG